MCKSLFRDTFWWESTHTYTPHTPPHTNTHTHPHPHPHTKQNKTNKQKTKQNKTKTNKQKQKHFRVLEEQGRIKLFLPQGQDFPGKLLFISQLHQCDDFLNFPCHSLGARPGGARCSPLPHFIHSCWGEILAAV